MSDIPERSIRTPKTPARTTARYWTTARLAVGLAAAVLALTAPAAWALAADGPDEKTAQAKTLSQEANALYAVGDFEQAAEKYQSAYKLKPDGALLYNAAQSYRQAGNNEKALLLYKNYVMFYPNARNRVNVEQQIAKLQEAIAAQHKAQSQPPTSTEPTGGTNTSIAPWAGGVAPSVTQTQTTEVGGAATSTSTASAGTSASVAGISGVAPTSLSSSSSFPGATLTETAPALSGSTPLYKKWWAWTAAGAVVGGAVAATLLLFGGSTKAWSTAPDFGPGAPKAVSR